MELPMIEAGYYESLYRLSIRDKAGLNGRKLNTIPESAVVEVTEIKYLTVSIWGKTEDGWICMYMNQTQYLRKRPLPQKKK